MCAYGEIRNKIILHVQKNKRPRDMEIPPRRPIILNWQLQQKKIMYVWHAYFFSWKKMARQMRASNYKKKIK